jgi:hypothetical protein
LRIANLLSCPNIASNRINHNRAASADGGNLNGATWVCAAAFEVIGQVVAITVDTHDLVFTVTGIAGPVIVRILLPGVEVGWAIITGIGFPIAVPVRGIYRGAGLAQTGIFITGFNAIAGVAVIAVCVADTTALTLAVRAGAATGAWGIVEDHELGVLSRKVIAGALTYRSILANKGEDIA